MRSLIDATGLFPSDLLDGMTAGFLEGSSGEERWLVMKERGAVTAVAYCAPERMTDGTWNLLLIAVRPSHQGQGRGAALVASVERLLAGLAGRVLLVETSALPQFERTRAFYQQRGFDLEARIRDYYTAGEDKIVFRKALARG